MTRNPTDRTGATRTAGRIAAVGLLSLLLGAGCGAEGGGGEAAARTVAWEPVAPVDTAVVLGAWPHDRTAFTQGFALDGGTLVESTGRYGESSIRLVRPETGEVLARADLDEQQFGEGAAVLGDRVYQVTWTTGVGYVYDRETLAPLDTVRYDGDAWGLTTDGESLILSDGTPRLRFLDPETFRTTRTVTVRDGDAEVWELNELEWVRGEVWANVWKTDRIARIDPETGRVVGWVNLSDLLDDVPIVEQEAVANGIAYDAEGDRLLLTGKLWPNVFRVRVGEIGSGTPPRRLPRRRTRHRRRRPRRPPKPRPRPRRRRSRTHPPPSRPEPSMTLVLRWIFRTVVLGLVAKLLGRFFPILLRFFRLIFR